MANSPRPGIINLDFKDVSQMAQNIQATNPWRTGISALGKILTDRERDILYRRAQAEALGTPTPDDTTTVEAVGKGASAIWDAVSGGASLLGKGAGKVYDILTAPDAVEKSYEEGEKIESPIFQGGMSREYIPTVSNGETSVEDAFAPNMSRLQAPIEESGTRVKFPTTVVGKDKTILPERREVGGKVDWASPNKGYETEFPTTVVGAPSQSQKPTQEEVSPIASTEQPSQKLNAPSTPRSQSEAWSEMYRLNPDRATFDWNRIAPKGSGAAGTVQARLEHDSKLDQEIATEAAALRKDMLANGWTSSSPEFLDRYATIMGLEAQKYVKGNKNDLIKLIGLTDKEFTQDQAKTKADLDAKKQDFAEQKEMTDIDQKAFEVTNSVMGDLLKKQYDKPAQLQATAADLRNAVADPNNINEASIKKAIKAFIQSIDNSVVMSFESQSFTDTSKLGQARNFINSLVDDNIYSPERLGEIWDNMVSSLAAYNSIADNLVTTAKDFYTQYGGKNVGVIDKWGNLIKANSSLGPKPDFSRVKAWWEKYKLGDKNSENPESVYSQELKSPPKAWSKTTRSNGKAASTVYDENSSTEGF